MIAARQVDQMYILCAILGASNGVYLTMETSLAVDTLPTPPSVVMGTHSSDDDSSHENGLTNSHRGHAQLLGSKSAAAFHILVTGID